MDCSTPGFPVHHYLQKFAQTHVHWVSDAIQPSHPLLPPSPPALKLSQLQGLFQWTWYSYFFPYVNFPQPILKRNGYDYSNFRDKVVWSLKSDPQMCPHLHLQTLNMSAYTAKRTLQIWLSSGCWDGGLSWRIQMSLIYSQEYLSEGQETDSEDTVMWWWKQRLKWYALKVEEGARSQWIQAASRNWKTQK